jgi:uncharacterized protein YciI
MKHFLLTYTLAPDYLDRRPAFRAEHLGLAQAAVARGELLLGGAAGEKGQAPDRAVLLFAGEDSRAAEAFARTDPYVTSGIVERWQVREWVTVVGEGAAQPVVGGCFMTDS